MVIATASPLPGPGNEPLTGTNFAARLVAGRESASLTQQQLADRSGVHVTRIRCYEASTNQPTPDEQEHVAAFIEGALLRHHAHQAFGSRAS